MKYAIVPIEPNRRMLQSMAGEPVILAASVEANLRSVYAFMLAARPPLDAEMQAALELARNLKRHYEHLRTEYPLAWGSETTSEERVALALLRANGEDV